ncbi:unnamed protein product [Adineta steineri]|uniref:Uncharacterized protein n=1 Tax=Adineta steineri TaxID=433720 RepID=A0A819ILY9_9BILA|nr:unnamed protein product [Adineta steineri]CAF3916673.1 unnamed protein product [Adineta steineri]
MSLYYYKVTKRRCTRKTTRQFVHQSIAYVTPSQPYQEQEYHKGKYSEVVHMDCTSFPSCSNYSEDNED